MPAIVVSDSSPLNILVRIGQAKVLASLFDRVIVPPEVIFELGHQKAPEIVRNFAASPPNWLIVQTPLTVLPIVRLDPGERAAISLAVELGALLLIDEREGRSDGTGVSGNGWKGGGFVW